MGKCRRCPDSDEAHQNAIRSSGDTKSWPLYRGNLMQGSGMDQPELSCSAFDEHHPPSNDLINECVHCGFCLPTCPTYALWGREMDSPRGRIYLMKLGVEGKIRLDPTFVSHMDNCLGCMACMSACPSGVK